MNKVWSILKSEPVSAFLFAVFLFLALCIISRARGGQPCNQRIVKHAKQNTVLVPYNYGHKNLLLELPADVVYSQIAYPIGVPVGTYSPVQYVAAPAGDGLQQPRLIERIIEKYAEPDEMPVEAEAIVEEPVCETPEKCELQPQKACAAHTPKATASPGAQVSMQKCSSCHTGAKAKAAHRPVFYDESGKFIATAGQKQKMLDAARMGTMPPSGPLDDRDYIALSDWLNPSGGARPVQKKKQIVGISLDGTSLLTKETE